MASKDKGKKRKNGKGKLSRLIKETRSTLEASNEVLETIAKLSMLAYDSHLQLCKLTGVEPHPTVTEMINTLVDFRCSLAATAPTGADGMDVDHQTAHQASHQGTREHHQAHHQARELGEVDHQAQRVPGRVPGADLPLGVPPGRELEARLGAPGAPGADPHHHGHGTGGELAGELGEQEQPDHGQTDGQRVEGEGQGQGQGEEEEDGETEIDSIHTVSYETLISLFSLESPHLEPQIRDSLMSHLSSPACDSVLNSPATLHYARMVFRKVPLTVN